jgi:hypothetical protein
LFCVKEKTKGRLVAEVNEEAMADFRIAVLRGIMLIGGVRRKADLARLIHEV